MNAPRKTLPPLPDHMRGLPIDERGYPIPFFVKWNDGKPDFRLLDEDKFIRCRHLQLCSICGKPLGKFRAFVGGPMNALQLISGEPPMHRDCALFAVRACPFLLYPMTKRRSSNLPDDIRAIGDVGDVFYEGNPGISCVWTCTTYHLSASKRVFHFEDCASVEWFTEGREATQPEIETALIAARDRLKKIHQELQP